MRERLNVVLVLAAMTVLFVLPALAVPGGIASGDPFRDNDWLNCRVFDRIARQSLLEDGQFPLRTHLLGGGFPIVAHPSDGSWAPTRLAWSVDNRTAGYRVVGAGASLRIECRIPGADVHPYLAFAAALASGLDGLERGAEPPSRFDGDAYRASELPQLPGSLREATERFAASRVVRRALGAAVVEHYRHFFEVEQAAFDSAVTDWERRRYFERI